MCMRSHFEQTSLQQYISRWNLTRASIVYSIGTNKPIFVGNPARRPESHTKSTVRREGIQTMTQVRSTLLGMINPLCGTGKYLLIAQWYGIINRPAP